jgi:hypothetical protein
MQHAKHSKQRQYLQFSQTKIHLNPGGASLDMAFMEDSAILWILSVYL